MVHIFIINSSTREVGFGEKLRQELSKVPGLTYFVFSTRKEGDEASLVELVLRMFDEDKIRIYCCGGSGTFRNVLNAIEKPDHVELAFMPFGMTNDFIKVFGEDGKRFTEVHELINGEVIDVDYMNTNYGKAINAVSFGADSLIISNVIKYRDFWIWNKQLPYVLAVIITIAKLSLQKFDISIDGITLTTKVSEGIFGNGNTIGGLIRFAACPHLDDGLARFVVVPTKNRYLLAKMIRKSVDENSTKVLSHLFHGNGHSFKLKKSNGCSFVVSFDGELVEIKDELTINMVKKGIHLVVPKGVTCP